MINNNFNNLKLLTISKFLGIPFNSFTLFLNLFYFLKFKFVKFYIYFNEFLKIIFKLLFNSLINNIMVYNGNNILIKSNILILDLCEF